MRTLSPFGRTFAPAEGGDSRRRLTRERSGGFVPTPSCVSRQPPAATGNLLSSTNISILRWSQVRSALEMRKLRDLRQRVQQSRCIFIDILKNGVARLCGGLRDPAHDRRADDQTV